MSDGFLKRWSERKLQNGSVPVTTDASPPVVNAPATQDEIPKPIAAVQTPLPEPGLPTLDDLRALTPASDFTRFMHKDVGSDLRNAALKTLFKDPQFNVMDMMDVYVDDYSKPDPIPAAMLKTLNQAVDLGLFRTKEEDEAFEAAANLRAESGWQPAVLAASEEPGVAAVPSALPSVPVAQVQGDPAVPVPDRPQ